MNTIALEPTDRNRRPRPSVYLTRACAGIVHMEDTTPANIGTPGAPPTVAAPTRSMWQQDSFTLKMLVRAAWGMRAPGHVAYVTGTSW